MTLPTFNKNGDLPVGVHQASLADVIDRFGSWPPQRRSVASRLMRIYRIDQDTAHVARFILFGSFVTNKPEPNDMDIFLLMDDDFDAGILSSETRLLSTTPRLKPTLGQAFFGCGAWQHSRENRRRLSIGKSSVTGAGEAL